MDRHRTNEYRGRFNRKWVTVRNAFFSHRVRLMAVVTLCFTAAAKGATFYVSLFGAGEIDKVSSTGVVTLFVTGLVNAGPLVFDASGNLYVGTNSEIIGLSTVQKITPNGIVSTYATGLTTPTALLFDSKGILYVAQEGGDLISKVTTSGVVSSFTTVPFEPEGLGFDQNGNLVVATGDANVYKVTSGGGSSACVIPRLLPFQPPHNAIAWA